MPRPATNRVGMNASCITSLRSSQIVETNSDGLRTRPRSFAHL